MTDEHNLAQAMEAAAAEIERQPVPLRAVAKAANTDLSDFDRLLNTAEKLLRYQQQRAIAAESDYQKVRTAVIDACRVRMEKLQLETEEELRSLDERHKVAMAEFERTIMALKGLRDGR